jgi:hypothetical protein
LSNNSKLIAIPNQTSNVHITTWMVIKSLWVCVKGSDAKEIYYLTKTIFNLER